MPKIRLEKSLEGKSPDDCFNAASGALEKVGFEIFKIREIAWLVMAHRTENDALIEASIGARPPGNNAFVVVSVTCPDLDKERLQTHADNIMAALEEAL